MNNNNNTKGRKKGKKLVLRKKEKDKIFFKMKNKLQGTQQNLIQGH